MDPNATDTNTIADQKTAEPNPVVDDAAKQQTEPAPEPAKEPVADKTDPDVSGDDNHDMRRMRKFIQRAFEAEAERDALRSAIEKSQQQTAVVGKPVRDNYNSDQEYFEALAEHNSRQLRGEFEQKLIEIRHQANAGIIESRIDDARKDIPDFDRVIQQGKEEVKNLDMILNFEPVAKSKNAARIQYELAKNPALAYEVINQMPIERAAYEIGKIEARIEAERAARSATPAPKPRQAPPPIKPLSTQGDAAPPDRSKMSDEEEFRLWQKEQLAKTRK